MTPEERKQTAADIAGIVARGYDLHVQAHGPDGSHAIRTEDGSRYEVAETTAGGAASFIELGGERFAVNVIPLGDALASERFAAAERATSAGSTS